MYHGFDYILDENTKVENIRNNVSNILSEPLSFESILSKKKKHNLSEKTLVFQTFKLFK